MVNVLTETMGCKVDGGDVRLNLSGIVDENDRLSAGLVDAGESLETCALRELKEETGYTAHVKHVSPGNDDTHL